MVTTVLEKRGYVVEIAHDGEEAYEKALANKPDLLITDVMMPKMDGWTLIRALRARPEFAFIPVIFLTALSSDDDRIRGFRLGADDYLPKPFRFEELDLRVAKTIKRSAIMERATREQISSPSHVTPDQQTGPISTAAAKPTLAGNLRQVGLSALLTLLEMERKSGILVVSEAPASGTPASAAGSTGASGNPPSDARRVAMSIGWIPAPSSRIVSAFEGAGSATSASCMRSDVGQTIGLGSSTAAWPLTPLADPCGPLAPFEPLSDRSPPFRSRSGNGAGRIS
jgi:CheY-like chemotaxis protein